jgi:hypothetical protein
MVVTVTPSGDQEDTVNVHKLNAELRRRVADGEYVVDPHAVAEAMLRRLCLTDRQRSSPMLVAAKLKRIAGGVEQA